MRDYVLLYVNGRRHEVRGAPAFRSLADFLRADLHLPGTKVVCAEGDCGACTVLVGRPSARGLDYGAVDACILFLYQLDGTHVLTVEGLAGAGTLHPVQEALVHGHGSQCGYCTPGFVMALVASLEDRRRDLRTDLTGNLCRCTGYVPILEAAAAVPPFSALADRYPSATIADDLLEHGGSSLFIKATSTKPAIFFGPRTLAEAIQFKVNHPEAVIVAGGTELGVLRNKQGQEPPVLLSLTHVPGLANIVVDNGMVTVGANVTWTQIEAFAKDTLPELHRLVIRFGSPQIRNVATLVANVAHGSPIADSLPFLYVMDAELEIDSPGGARRVNINGFYKGYKVKDLAAHEIITHVRFPLPAAGDLLKLYKVSRRNDLDIATFGAAVRIRRSGSLITRAYLAYSGVGPTVVRLPRTEAYLQGKAFVEATFHEAGRLAAAEVHPISDVRGARDFRLRLAENILVKFWLDREEMDHVAVGTGDPA